jgi:hypothetical protein
MTSPSWNPARAASELLRTLVTTNPAGRSREPSWMTVFPLAIKKLSHENITTANIKLDFMAPFARKTTMRNKFIDSYATK